jgi:hypothetical protein
MEMNLGTILYLRISDRDRWAVSLPRDLTSSSVDLPRVQFGTQVGRGGEL